MLSERLTTAPVAPETGVTDPALLPVQAVVMVTGSLTRAVPAALRMIQLIVTEVVLKGAWYVRAAFAVVVSVVGELITSPAPEIAKVDAVDTLEAVGRAVIEAVADAVPNRTRIVDAAVVEMLEEITSPEAGINRYVPSFETAVVLVP